MNSTEKRLHEIEKVLVKTVEMMTTLVADHNKRLSDLYPAILLLIENQQKGLAAINDGMFDLGERINTLNRNL